jgi:hypothetical protein
VRFISRDGDSSGDEEKFDARRILNSPWVVLKCEELQKVAGQEPVCSSLSEWSAFFIGGVEVSTSEEMQIRL